MEDPFETEKIWHKMYRGNIYGGRRGVGLHAMSGIDIALWREALTRRKLRARDGYLDIPQEPGLGIELDEEAVARFRQ